MRRETAERTKAGEGGESQPIGQTEREPKTLILWIIEDNTIFQKFLIREVGLCGFPHPLAMGSVAECRTLLAEGNRPDIVLLDGNLEEHPSVSAQHQDAQAVLTLLARHDCHPHIIGMAGLKFLPGEVWNDLSKKNVYQLPEVLEQLLSVIDGHNQYAR
ncbi:response regulator [Patescibacteria group bacterium]|nr:response regulator [Patescibacteria group bacterium]